MKEPLVSVNMITYNHAPYIAQAIEGVLRQETSFPFELVIGEDCSTDGTREIVFDYQKKYPEIISVITSDKNVGACKNSLRTEKACRGKYIAYCEGDDYWHHPQKLQKQLDYLETHPECGLVHSDGVQHIVEQGRTLPFYDAHKKEVVLHGKNVVRSMIENDYYVITCSAIVRKDLLDEIHKTCPFEFSETCLSSDFETWIEMAHRSKVKYIDESLVTYNILPESAIHNRNLEKKLRLQEYCLKMHLHYADKYGGDSSMEIKKKVVAHLNRNLMSLAYRACKPALAREVLERARKFQVPLDLMGHLHFIGSQNIVTFCLVWVFLLPVRLGRKMLRVVCGWHWLCKQ